MDRLTELLARIADIGTLDDDALAALVSEIREATTEALASATGADRLALASTLAEMATGIESIGTLQAQRAEEAAAAETALAEVLARIVPAEPEVVEPEIVEPEPVVLAVEPEPVIIPEPVVVAAPVALAIGTPRAPALARPAAQAMQATTARVTVLGDTVRADANGDVWQRLASAFADRAASLGPSAGSTSERFKVASFHADYAPERTFTSVPDSDTIARTTERLVKSDVDYINSLSNGQGSGWSLVAAGGVCGPQTPYYEQVLLADARRPVRDALTALQVTRGGIQYTPSMTLAAIKANVAGGAVTVHTNTDDINSVVKTVQRINCGTSTPALIYSVVSYLLFGNLFARTSPEQMKNAIALTAAQHSRIAEQKLLALIDSFSTADSVPAKVYGASRDLLYQVGVAVSGYRQRHRALRTVRLNAIFPEWVLDILKGDVTRALNADRDWFEVTDTDIIRWFSNLGVDVSFTPDESFLGAQQIGGLNDYPDTVKWRLFHKGMFLFLDGGDLDLGIVRDSSLNSTNDFQMFSETFEGLAPVGLESLVITSTVCADGTSAATKDPGSTLCVSHAATDNS